VKVVDFDVAKPKLIGYHSNVPWATTKLLSVFNPHTRDYLRWKADEDQCSSCRRMDDDRQIEAELQCNFHLLGCSPPKLLDRSSPKFYTI